MNTLYVWWYVHTILKHSVINLYSIIIVYNYISASISGFCIELKDEIFWTDLVMWIIDVSWLASICQWIIGILPVTFHVHVKLSVRLGNLVSSFTWNCSFPFEFFEWFVCTRKRVSTTCSNSRVWTWDGEKGRSNLRPPIL